MGKERTKSAHQLPLTGDNIGGVSSSSFFFFFLLFILKKNGPFVL
jgi:hypothetical protein